MGNIMNMIIGIIILAILFLVFIPHIEQVAEDDFNNTISKLKENNYILTINMSKTDKQIFNNNSCDIVFKNPQYRIKDAELCKQILSNGGV
jgi:uncharacterized membrane protein